MEDWLGLSFGLNNKQKKTVKKEDFLAYYTTLSNVELLKIIREKKKYKPDAIDAATEILSTRTYSEDENSVATAEVNFDLTRKREQKEKANKIKSQINVFIDKHFGINERTPQQKLNLFCAVISIYSLINDIVNFNDLLMLFFYYKDPRAYMFAILICALEFFFIYLLYRRSNWGWVFFILSSSLNSVIEFQTLLSSFNPGGNLFSIFINIAILIYLNSRGAIQQFTITKDGRQTTFIIVGLIACLILFFGYFV